MGTKLAKLTGNNPFVGGQACLDHRAPPGFTYQPQRSGRTNRNGLRMIRPASQASHFR